MYARNENAEQNTTDIKGKPLFVVYVKNLGALPTSARPCNAREAVYRSEEAALHADVSSAALMTDGNPLMPALFMAITKGDPAAVELRFKSGLFEGTSRLITKTPKI